MSALSFREQAAITIFASPKGLGGQSMLGAVEQAQKIADLCCETWGHVDGAGLQNIALLVPCPRCGKASVSR